MNYQIYDLVVDSDFSLTGLALSSALENKISIRCATLSETFQRPSRWFMQWYLPGGKLWLSFAKLDGGYLLRFNELADFFVSNTGEKIIYQSKLGIPSNTIRHLLLDQVIPLVINLRGGEALHASAVLAPQGVIAFTGPTGLGKSTLAGDFLLSGYQHVSDDCLVLIEKNHVTYAIPAYPGLRLWEDSAAKLFGENGNYHTVAHYTKKHRVDIGTTEICTEPQPLRRIYFIADLSAKGKTEIAIESLSSSESFMALIRSAFRLDITDRNMLSRQFQCFEKIASTVSVRRLIFPRDFNILPYIREAILHDLQDLGN